jgi:hypothetical protein
VRIVCHPPPGSEDQARRSKSASIKPAVAWRIASRLTRICVSDC